MDHRETSGARGTKRHISTLTLWQTP